MHSQTIKLFENLRNKNLKQQGLDLEESSFIFIGPTLIGKIVSSELFFDVLASLQEVSRAS